MTFGMLAFIIIGVVIFLFFVGGSIFQRYENGHWGKPRSIFDTDLLGAGVAVLWGVFVAGVGILGATVLSGLLLRLLGVEVFA